MKKRLLIGVSGASGAPLAVELLNQMQKYRDVYELHFIITKSGEITLKQEMDKNVEELIPLVDTIYDNENIGGGPASGSYKTAGMIIVPCSMKTMAGIVSGYSDNLLLRVADVMLKERRKLLIVPRECPLGTIHLRNMYELSQMGAIVIPPVLSYYNHPKSVADCTRHIVGKIMDQLDLEVDKFNRWEGI